MVGADGEFHLMSKTGCAAAAILFPSAGGRRRDSGRRAAECMTSQGVRSARDATPATREGGRHLWSCRQSSANLAQATMHPKDGGTDGRTDGGPFSINLVVRPFVRGAATGQNTVVGTSQKHTHAEPRSREEDDDKRQCAESNDSLKK